LFALHIRYLIDGIAGDAVAEPSAKARGDRRDARR
jgi:hypothetical protein